MSKINQKIAIIKKNPSFSNYVTKVFLEIFILRQKTKISFCSAFFRIMILKLKLAKTENNFLNILETIYCYRKFLKFDSQTKESSKILKLDFFERRVLKKLKRLET